MRRKYHDLGSFLILAGALMWDYNYPAEVLAQLHSFRIYQREAGGSYDFSRPVRAVANDARSVPCPSWWMPREGRYMAVAKAVSVTGKTSDPSNEASFWWSPESGCTLMEVQVQAPQTTPTPQPPPPPGSLASPPPAPEAPPPVASVMNPPEVKPPTPAGPSSVGDVTQLCQWQGTCTPR